MPRRKVRDKLFSPPVLVPLCALCGECFSAAAGVPGSLSAGSLFGLQFGKQGEVFLCETGQGQQLGAIAPRFFQGPFAAPAAGPPLVFPPPPPRDRPTPENPPAPVV